MSTDGARIDATFPRLVQWGREVAAVLVAGVLAALAWMFLMQEGQAGRILEHTWTEHDFPDGLGHLLGSEDTARAGLFATLALGVIAVAIYAVAQRAVHVRLRYKALGTAIALFLLWGLVFTPLVNSRQVLVGAEFQYLPTGFFGTDAGAATILSGIVASLVTAVLIARVYSLMRDGDWWRERAVARQGVLGTAADELLELPEQRPEQGVERSR